MIELLVYPRLYSQDIPFFKETIWFYNGLASFDHTNKIKIRTLEDLDLSSLRKTLIFCGYKIEVKKS